MHYYITLEIQYDSDRYYDMLYFYIYKYKWNGSAVFNSAMTPPSNAMYIIQNNQQVN